MKSDRSGLQAWNPFEDMPEEMHAKIREVQERQRELDNGFYGTCEKCGKTCCRVFKPFSDKVEWWCANCISRAFADIMKAGE
jgi:hypothetical protein